MICSCWTSQHAFRAARVEGRTSQIRAVSPHGGRRKREEIPSVRTGANDGEIGPYSVCCRGPGWSGITS